MSGTREEAERALQTTGPVSKDDYLRWAHSPDLRTQAYAYLLSTSFWDRIQPEPTMDEQCRFILNHLLTCIEVHEPDEYILGGFEAGHELARWLKHLSDLPDTEDIIREAAARLADLHKKLDAAGRNRLETGALEHVLERPALRAYFEFWGNHPALREGYRLSLAWGLAHEDHPHRRRRNRDPSRS